MKREFIETPSFTKRWYSLGFTDDDLAELQFFLLNNPDAEKNQVKNAISVLKKEAAENWRKEK